MVYNKFHIDNANLRTYQKESNLENLFAHFSNSKERFNWTDVSIPSIVKKCFSIRFISGIGNSLYTTRFSATTTSLNINFLIKKRVFVNIFFYKKSFKFHKNYSSIIKKAIYIISIQCTCYIQNFTKFFKTLSYI